jgi:VanW like protein/Glycosyl transferases group 1
MEKVTLAQIPSRLSSAIFTGKATLLQLERAAQNFAQSVVRHPQSADASFSLELARSATQLWTDTNPTEAWYQRGKIQNLRRAASRLHLCIIPAGVVFSFWRQVGRASARKGYVAGRMLQEGCMIPAIGGGLCQLSNAIYQVAVEAGCEILERHPHSRIVPGSATANGRDATVAWNYIDLRFRSNATVQLGVVLTATELIVSLHAASPIETVDARSPKAKRATGEVPGVFSDHACESCGNTTCFRHDTSPVKLATRSVSAFLLDAAWPEFQTYVASHHGGQDRLATPIDGIRWNRPQYAWPTEGFADRYTATLVTLIRAIQSRHLGAQGAMRQKALLESAATLAKHLAKALTPDVDEVCVSQSLLPFLWRTGALGGRRIRVLMTQLPGYILQKTLDDAYLLHPESATLHDFRANPEFLDAEHEALVHAEQIITPHAHLASLFPTRTMRLDWSMPKTINAEQRKRSAETPTILFPSATLGRKGAYELREALHGLDIKLLLGGRILEDPHFWRGFDVETANPTAFSMVDVVVLPSIVESQPRSLLRALATGVPVITTPESGLHPSCGAHFVRKHDWSSLHAAICERL